MQHRIPPGENGFRLRNARIGLGLTVCGLLVLSATIYALRQEVRQLEAEVATLNAKLEPPMASEDLSEAIAGIPQEDNSLFREIRNGMSARQIPVMIEKTSDTLFVVKVRPQDVDVARDIVGKTGSKRRACFIYFSSSRHQR